MAGILTKRVPQGMAAAPACEPYYNQATLPKRLQPGAIVPPVPGNEDTRERFHAFGSVTTPAAGSAAVTLATFQVPNGHAGAVVGLICFYDGSGFTEGVSTSLYFSLRLNGASYVRDYQTIPNTMGGLATGPFPLPGTIKLNAGDLIEFLGTVPAGSPITTGGSTRLHGHMIGYYWPVQA